MRVLLTSHLALDEAPAGRFVAELAAQLIILGHEALVLVDHWVQDTDELKATRKSASPFESCPDLTDDALVDLRQILRNDFDEAVNAFDPHIVHAQHVWLHGHLALEAGVPYVLTAWGDELAAVEQDVRFRRFAQEAAENAGRVFVDSPALERKVINVFGAMDGHVVVACQRDRVTPDCAKTLAAAYRDVLIARFGSADRP
jgi:hypothetical protein